MMDQGRGAPRLPAHLWHRALRGAVLALACMVGQAAFATDRIASATYQGPTSRYPHGVLGDKIEHDTLAVTLTSGTTLRATYPHTIVFEDIAPRVVDLDQDGSSEVIVVESHKDLGARLAVWALRNGKLAPLTQTPYIGKRFRWLAPIGAADLDGDGLTEIAYIDRPHLAKTLRVWRFVRTETGAKLTEIASKPGLTNHRIGEEFITGGIRNCGNGPEIVTVDANWQNIMATQLADNTLTSKQISPFKGPQSVNDALNCRT